MDGDMASSHCGQIPLRTMDYAHVHGPLPFMDSSSGLALLCGQPFTHHWNKLQDIEEGLKIHWRMVLALSSKLGIMIINFRDFAIGPWTWKERLEHNGDSTLPIILPGMI